MRILIDLTDIEGWSGTHGGIQRVVYGIAKNFYINDEANDSSLSFIRFSSQKSKFQYADFKPIYDRVESLQDGGVNVEEPSPSLKHRVRMAIRTKVPEKIRSNELARKSFKNSIKFTKYSIHKTKTVLVAKQSGQDDNLVVFDKYDVVLILGKPWDDLTIQKTLAAEKKQTNFKLVQTVYDLIICLYPHLHHPSLFESYTQHMFEAASASDLMLPISKSSERDLKLFCERLKLKVPPTKVIRLGDDIVNQEKFLATKKPDPRIDSSFLLCVGTIEIRKNHSLIYYAYKLAEEKGIELPQMIIVGSKGWLSSDSQYLINKDLSLKNKVIIIHGASDSSLNWLYKNCRFTVYPSMYEGWGLPIAESLAYGKPCVSSGTSSMKEIAGDLVDYFSPYDPGEFLEKVSTLLDEKTYKEKTERVKENYKPVTWEQTFKQVLKAIEEL